MFIPFETIPMMPQMSSPLFRNAPPPQLLYNPGLSVYLVGKSSHLLLIRVSQISPKSPDPSTRSLRKVHTFHLSFVSPKESSLQVISDPMLQRRGVPLLLVCNKTDEGAKAHTTDFVRKRLEKELEALRGTRATLGEGAPQGGRIAREGEAFTFVGLRSPRVSVAGGSALTGDLNEVLEFLR